MTLTDLITEHGAASWDKQMCLMDVIGEKAWSLDVKRGLLTFGGRMTFPVQLLGSEAEAAGTWLWAWANEASNFPPELTEASRQMRELGRQYEIAALSDPEVSLDNVSGHLLGMIASGVCGADAYYRGPYNGGAAFMLLTAPEVKGRADSSVTAFIRIFTEFISAFDCSHRPALEAYARYKAYSYAPQADGTLLCMSPSGASVTAAFDDLGRLSKFSATLTADSMAETPGTKAPKKPWWKLGG